MRSSVAWLRNNSWINKVNNSARFNRYLGIQMCRCEGHYEVTEKFAWDEYRKRGIGSGICHKPESFHLQSRVEPFEVSEIIWQILLVWHFRATFIDYCTWQQSFERIDETIHWLYNVDSQALPLWFINVWSKQSTKVMNSAYQSSARHSFYFEFNLCYHQEIFLTYGESPWTSHHLPGYNLAGVSVYPHHRYDCQSMKNQKPINGRTLICQILVSEVLRLQLSQRFSCYWSWGKKLILSFISWCISSKSVISKSFVSFLLAIAFPKAWCRFQDSLTSLLCSHWSLYLPSWTINSLLFWSNFLSVSASSPLHQNSRNSLSIHCARWSCNLGSRKVTYVIWSKDFSAMPNFGKNSMHIAIFLYSQNKRVKQKLEIWGCLIKHFRMSPIR
jgi:hypothetical protein